MRHALFIAMFPALLILLCAGSPAVLAAQPETQTQVQKQTAPVSVDYVIGMLEAGMSQQAIVKSVRDRGVTFVLEPEDLDRLREAGAGDLLVRTVMDRGEAVDNAPPAGDGEGAAGPEGSGADLTTRPRRLVEGEAGASPQSQTQDMCDIYYCPGDYASAYYYPGYYPYNYYPGFYAGYYYPYGYPYGYYYYGNYGHYGGHHRGRISPRGAPRGQPGTTPPGGQMSPRGSPRGGSSGAPSNRGSSSPSRPRSPRGGHR